MRQTKTFTLNRLRSIFVSWVMSLLCQGTVRRCQALLGNEVKKIYHHPICTDCCFSFWKLEARSLPSSAMLSSCLHGILKNTLGCSSGIREHPTDPVCLETPRTLLSTRDSGKSEALEGAGAELKPMES